MYIIIIIIIRASDRKAKVNADAGSRPRYVGFETPCIADFFSADFQCRLSYGVRTALVCNRRHPR